MLARKQEAGVTGAKYRLYFTMTTGERNRTGYCIEPAFHQLLNGAQFMIREAIDDPGVERQ